MTDFIFFWLAKTVAEILIWMVVVGAIVGIYAMLFLIQDRRSRKRKTNKEQA